MTAKIVTDSCSDITQDEAKRLGIIVVPAYVHFGDKSFRDGVDMTYDEFYDKLLASPVHPSTAAPSPGEFAKVYEQAAQETNEIVSIHVTSKHSAIYDAALAGKEMVEKKGCQIEVIDSKGVTMWQGLVAMAAARAARNGCTLHQIIKKSYDTIDRLRTLALLDTFKYAVKGGRLGKAASAIESLLNVKPLIALRDGEVVPIGMARSRCKGLSRLREFLQSTRQAEDIAIVHSTTADEAQSLADYARSLFPNLIPRISRLGPALGVHGGPGAIAAIIQETT
ncbi:MAG: DegV family protein [Chloroflexi bacterium]|nr:DegV family protein [Chloroflexota bacterium]MBM3174511.1 DegV family protein [Chloroflexota bacterium]MBM4449646.1 DegV family protein [Chloroflexota bacterium]